MRLCRGPAVTPPRVAGCWRFLRRRTAPVKSCVPRHRVVGWLVADITVNRRFSNQIVEAGFKLAAIPLYWRLKATRTAPRYMCVRAAEIFYHHSRIRGITMENEKEPPAGGAGPEDWVQCAGEEKPEDWVQCAGEEKPEDWVQCGDAPH